MCIFCGLIIPPAILLANLAFALPPLLVSDHQEDGQILKHSSLRYATHDGVNTAKARRYRMMRLQWYVHVGAHAL